MKIMIASGDEFRGSVFKSVIESLGVGAECFDNASALMMSIFKNRHQVGGVIVDLTSMDESGLIERITGVRDDMPVLICASSDFVLPGAVMRNNLVREIVLTPVDCDSLVVVIRRFFGL